MNLTSKTVHQILLVIIITFLSSHLSILASADQDASSSDQTDAGLFINDPYILSLNDQNLAANIFGQSEATVVMFYANWCGHCQHTAPVYSQLGSRIRPWRSAVKLVAINCANERYADVCREMGVIGYPTIVFSPSKTEEMADFVSLNEALNPVSAVPGAGDATDGLYSAILRQLNRARRGAVHPILVANKEEICGSFGFASPSTAPETTAYAIVENAPSVTSAEIILDLLEWRDVVRIKRFYDRTSSLSESLATIHVTLPAILQVNLDGCTFKSVMNSGENMAALKYDFERSITSKYPKPEDKQVFLRPKSATPPIENFQKVPKYRLSYIDLYNTMRTSILDEMLKVHPYTEQHVLAIKMYFSVIYRYFPFRNENVRRLFKRMNMWLDAHDVGNMNRVNLREAVRISDGFLWPMESYRFCNGSQPKFRGYPCGLWVLFHVLTVNEYLKPPTGGVKHEVMFMMRNYTATFFTCKQCAEHFAEATKDMSAELVAANSSVLFLWRLHNQVNQRLEGDPYGEDPAFPKAIFPGWRDCPSCVANETDSLLFGLEGGGGGQFELPEVLNFLTEFYSKKSISNGGISVHGGLNFSPTFVLLLFLCALCRLVCAV